MKTYDELLRERIKDKCGGNACRDPSRCSCRRWARERAAERKPPKLTAAERRKLMSGNYDKLDRPATTDFGHVPMPQYDVKPSGRWIDRLPADQDEEDYE